MSKRKYGLALSLVLAAGTLLGACGTDKEKEKDNSSSTGGNESDFSVAMVTDVGGVDDKSFNQSAWEGIKKFGEENGLTEGDGGYAYLQSKGEADYTPNLNALTRRDFDLVFRCRIHDGRCQSERLLNNNRIRNSVLSTV